MSGCPTSVARTYHHDETWDCLRVRTYGNRALEVLVSVTPHQGRREGRLQGEAAQGYALAGGSARDVRMLNWNKSDSGEPRDAETVLRGSGKGGGKRPGYGTSPAAYFIALGLLVIAPVLARLRFCIHCLNTHTWLALLFLPFRG